MLSIESWRILSYNVVCAARGVMISDLKSKLIERNRENERQASDYSLLLREYRGILCNTNTIMHKCMLSVSLVGHDGFCNEETIWSQLQ